MVVIEIGNGKRAGLLPISRENIHRGLLFMPKYPSAVPDRRTFLTFEIERSLESISTYESE